MRRALLGLLLIGVTALVGCGAGTGPTTLAEFFPNAGAPLTLNIRAWQGAVQPHVTVQPVAGTTNYAGNEANATPQAIPGTNDFVAHFPKITLGEHQVIVSASHNGGLLPSVDKVVMVDVVPGGTIQEVVLDPPPGL